MSFNSEIAKLQVITIHVLIYLGFMKLKRVTNDGKIANVLKDDARKITYR
jgi:hypothetical protein